MGRKLGVVKRPWGMYSVLHSSGEYWIKLLRIKAGHRTSLQSHKDRGEHWIVMRGSGLAERENWDCTIDVHELKVGTMMYICKESKHRITASKEEDLLICEVALGKPDENDICRYEDDYGRIK
jgi:mannose-6-phosphate isomerase-like protein (cupin superfamily)